MKFTLSSAVNITPSRHDKTKYWYANQDALGWALKTGNPVLEWYMLSKEDQTMYLQDPETLPGAFEVELF